MEKIYLCGYNDFIMSGSFNVYFGHRNTMKLTNYFNFDTIKWPLNKGAMKGRQQNACISSFEDVITKLQIGQLATCWMPFHVDIINIDNFVTQFCILIRWIN